MAQVITDQQVQHVAKLARLAIPAERLPQFTKRLENILGYVAKLGEVNVEGVEPSSHALPLSNVLRADVVGPTLNLEAVLQNAPQRDGPFFRVPKVLGGDEDSAG